MFAQLRIWFLALLMVWALSHASVFGGSGEPPAARELSPAEKTRKILDQSMNLDYTGRSLQEVVHHLKEKIRVSIVLDVGALQQVRPRIQIRPDKAPMPTLGPQSDKEKGKQPDQKAGQ